MFLSPLWKQHLSDLSISIRDTKVSPSSKVKDLDVVCDQYLSFHDHISGICKSIPYHLRSFGRIRNLLTFDATAQLPHKLQKKYITRDTKPGITYFQTHPMA